MQPHLSFILVMELKGVDDQVELIVLPPGEEVGPRTWEPGVNQAPIGKGEIENILPLQLCQLLQIGIATLK